jgi:photosystem II stability/assembly factor-like uncharacterized protein
MTRARRLAALAAVVTLLCMAWASQAGALASAGGAWVWQNPLPFGWDLSNVRFSDEQHAWATTYIGGVVLRSDDAGQTWQPSFTGVDGAMTSMSFPDESHGFVLYTETSGYGGADVVASTADGGATWTKRVYPPRQYGGLFDQTLDFVDGDYGWMTGGWRSAGARRATPALLSTTDGGATWTPHRLPGGDLAAVDFVDRLHGWVTTWADQILVTADGGRTWARRSLGLRGQWVDLRAVTADGAWALVGGSVLLRTTDGGRHWTRSLRTGQSWLAGFATAGLDEAWLVDSNDRLGAVIGGEVPNPNSSVALHHTTDGGATWATTWLGQDFAGSDLAASPGGIVLGVGPAIWRSADHGATWGRLNGNGDHSLYDVAFVDATHGWAVGDRADTLAWADPGELFGAILHTADGVRWVQQPIPPGPSLLAVSFADADHGWAVGAHGRVLRTTDGGATWTAAPRAGDLSLHDVQFLDQQNGWALGYTDRYQSLVLRTVDGGDTWAQTSLARSQEASSVQFVSATHGWLAGDVYNGTDAGAPLLLETTDGGLTWVRRTAGQRGFSRVTFVDADHGWLLQEGKNNLGSVLRTTDGGATWAEAALPGIQYNHAGSLSFADADHGWAVGDRIWKTEDGGATWAIEPAQVAPWFMDWTLEAVAAVPGGAAWAVGDGGRILSTVDTTADTAAPQTVDDGDRVWHDRDVTVHLHAADVGGGAVARTEYRVDGESTWHEGDAATLGAPADHYGDGVHTLRYRSVDDSGNVERTRICPILIDTAAPWAGADNEPTVRRGHKVSLRYDLEDNLSPSVWVTVRIYRAFFFGSAKLVRTLHVGLQGVGANRRLRFRCTLRRGTYSWIVYATDLAGNEFVPWASESLTVR